MQVTKQKVYKKVYDMACEELLRSDVQERCEAAGISCKGTSRDSTIAIPFFDEVITFSTPGFSFKSSKDANVTLVSKIILLHYLISASGAKLGGELIPYEDILGLRHYFPVYEKRVLKPLQTAFGNDRYAFLEAGLSLGAIQQEYADASFTLQVLPRIPITFILWEGDAEFPPLLRTLFDPTIPGYLPLEDIVVISKLATTRILKEARLKHANDGLYNL
ncbi:MAG: hypothetical protein H6Q54_1646 [Deltaproteobacteria bacterium]|nr:hypothetical protein [Deltaproteobacteria bacterium]